MGRPILEKGTGKTLRPILVGAGVPGLTGWGKVVSSFAGAVNLRHPQGLLVSLVEDPRNMTSLSVCVPALFRKQERRLFPGKRVRFEGPSLATADFVLDLQGRPIWQGRITGEDVKGLSPSKILLLKRSLVSMGRDGGFLGLLRREQTDNAFVSKARRVLVGGQVLCGLVGLGPGSTPSGDDFVAGVLMREEAKAVAEHREPVIPWSAEKEGLEAAMDRTNDAGKTLLWQALHGRFPSYLIEAVRSVSEAKGQQEIDEAVERAVGHGATSGTDALVGFVFSREGAFEEP